MPIRMAIGWFGVLLLIGPAGDRAWAQSPPLDYFSVTPCRRLDTRVAGQGPALASGTPRVVNVSDSCGIPPAARAIAANITSVAPTGAGNLRLYPGDGIAPTASALNFSGGQTRANNGVFPLATNGNGTLAIVATVSGGGTVHAVLDVAGYFAPSPPRVRFAAFGDTGKGNAGQQSVADAVEAKCAASGCDFLQLLGDNIYDNGVSSVNDPEFQPKFEVPYAALTLPFYMILGNHDYGGGGAGYELVRAQNQISYTQLSPRWRMPAHYYQRVHQHVAFFALDTVQQFFANYPPFFATDAAQRLDVAAWLAASSATWKIAVGHHPYRSNGPHGNAGTYDGVLIPPVNGAGVKEFMEQIVCGNADLYISAHDHSLQWLVPDCAGTELIVSGSGASPPPCRARTRSTSSARAWASCTSTSRATASPRNSSTPPGR